jgi:CRP-like cAMP-binding protein
MSGGAAALATMRGVPWLASLGEDALAEVIDAGDIVTFADGRPLVRELEVGDSALVILSGRALVTVEAGQAVPLSLGELRAGDACGELSLLTGELRSATVTAIGELQALRIDRVEFEALLGRHPQIAVHFAREIAARLADSDDALDLLLQAERHDDAPAHRLSGRTTAVTPVPGSLRRAFRELVSSRLREPPFLAMLAFLVALVAIRLLAWTFHRAGLDLFPLLRAAYTAGIALVIASVATSFQRFSPRTRRAIALTYGIGFALIFNELSVFLAFDTFYLDMTTRDPALAFSVEALYRRSESQWAVALALFILVQAAYLRRFYRRSAFILATRARRLLSRP